jgi:hypothetical protein
VISSGNEREKLSVQVDEYPIITATRIMDTTSANCGKWYMENMYVYFLQVESIDGSSLPLS